MLGIRLAVVRLTRQLTNADLHEYVSATFSGNVVTIKDTFWCRNFGRYFCIYWYCGTATYTTINGGAASDAVVNLGGATANVGTTFTTTAASPQYVAAADAKQAGTAAVYAAIDGNIKRHNLFR